MILSRVIPLLFIVVITACGGGNSDSADAYHTAGIEQPNQWERIPIAQIEENGETLPYVTVRQDQLGNSYIAYYSAVTLPDTTQYHQLNQLVWNPARGVVSHTVVDTAEGSNLTPGFARCAQFDFAIDPVTHLPVYVYPSDEDVLYPEQAESDIMVNLSGAGGWYEYTAAIGYVERNPRYQDGHVYSDLSVALDAFGGMHVSYQFFYEGIDANNFAYPDLFYVHRQESTISQALSNESYLSIEEQVDGNYFGNYGIHNSVGYHCKLLLDPNNLPIVFYSEETANTNTYSLKMASKNASGSWTVETVEDLPDEWKVGAISAAMYPDGSLGVAYYVVVSTEDVGQYGPQLKFATNQSGEWIADIVDEATWCGNYCSLAIDGEGRPAIAYFDERSHAGHDHQFLKVASYQREGLPWLRETVSEKGAVGRYNTLWFDEGNRPYVCSYAQEDQEVLIFRRID